MLFPNLEQRNKQGSLNSAVGLSIFHPPSLISSPVSNKAPEDKTWPEQRTGTQHSQCIDFVLTPQRLYLGVGYTLLQFLMEETVSFPKSFEATEIAEAFPSFQKA